MPVTARTTVQMLWRDPNVSRDFRAGVSLHSHTEYSEECLDMVPKYLGKVPFLQAIVSPRIPFSSAFWTPPLTPRQAYRLEEKQIQRTLQLPAFVSLSDHDSIVAGTLLHLMDRFRHSPISTEWTVPFGSTFFHLGVHNLPASDAESIHEQLLSYTAKPLDESLFAVLTLLNAHPEVLIVVNHPLWDEDDRGFANHHQQLIHFLSKYGHLVHALEINGLRTWTENQQVLGLANSWNLPVVAGGDRHGREANAVLNLSCGTSFAAFVHEVRYERWSHVVLLPQYRGSRALRTTRMVFDALRTYPEMVHARQTWQKRVFYRVAPGATPEPLTSVWQNGRTPFIICAVNMVLALMSSDVAKPVLRWASRVETAA